MAYKITEWTGTSWVSETHEQIAPGVYDLYITSADCDSDMTRYTIEVEDIRTAARGKFTFWLTTRQGTVNTRAVGTLGTLGRALFNQDVGVPFFEDVIHGVVHAEIKESKPYMAQTGELRTYQNIYEFSPVTAEAYVAALQKYGDEQTIEQYVEGTD